MNVRLENIHTESSPANYVSFLSQSQRSKGRSDRDSIHSVSSVRSVMSGVSALWFNFGLGGSSSAAKSEKAKAQLMVDLRYLYSAFTKIPCLRLSPDRKARLIGGYEEFPFDTAVPLYTFKNMSALEITDVDFRQFFGWDRLADQLRSLTVKRADLEDPSDLLTAIVLDDMDKRRRRSSRNQSSPIPAWPPSPSLRHRDVGRAETPPSPKDGKGSHSTSPRDEVRLRRGSEDIVKLRPRTKSTSPTRPTATRQNSNYRHVRSGNHKLQRSSSGSSTSSAHSVGRQRGGSSSNLLSLGILPASKWRFLRHLSLADNSITHLPSSSLSPLTNTLHSLDLSSNLFSEVPDCLATLTALRALNLSNCMIESLHSVARNPLPAITSLNLRSNRLASLAGIERLLSLERLDVRENRLSDPTEMARLTGAPEIREIWVAKNPFVKTHSNNRVTIFNLFRNTPGYLDDIMIDSTGPTYNERRQLMDRVIEPEGVPVVKPLSVDVCLDVPSEEKARCKVLPLVGEVSPTVTTMPEQTPEKHDEKVVGSHRRKRGPRRRIVDLSKDESALFSPPPTQLETPSLDPIAKPNDRSRDLVSPSEAPSAQNEEKSDRPQPHLRLETSYFPPIRNQSEDISAEGLSLANDIRNSNVNGETYRRKVEALKREVGSNWLSVLSEEGWDEPRRTEILRPEFRHASTGRPEISNFRTASQGIVSGGRLLG